MLAALRLRVTGERGERPRDNYAGSDDRKRPVRQAGPGDYEAGQYRQKQRGPFNISDFESVHNEFEGSQARSRPE